MTKKRSFFSCDYCGAQYKKWQGQCAECQRWSTIKEDLSDFSSSDLNVVGHKSCRFETKKLSDISLQSQARLPTGLAEFDHVLGGGLVSDSVVLIGGQPGVGKSTLLLQVMSKISKNYSAVYITGEESLQQVALRAHRLALDTDDLRFLAETNVERIIALTKKERPKVMVVDSIQTVFTEDVSGPPGGVGQVRESAARLVQYVKRKGIALFLLGHVTKEGVIAGPRVLEHMVDAVLYFEGEGHQNYRVIRAVKNRFGALNELGVFEMTNKGVKQVSNPSATFLSRKPLEVAGSVVMVSWEGSRPLLLEVQALVNESYLSNPRRVTVGLDCNRIGMLLAILNRHAGVATHNKDIFVNAVGGLRITETGSDLAVIGALISSLKDCPFSRNQVVFGELGLSGEVRPVSGGQERLREAQKHGFKRAIIPKANKPKSNCEGIKVILIERLSELLNYL